MHSAEIDIEGMQASAKRLVENFISFSKHTPKVLRDSMVMSYCKAIDEMFMAMDHNKIKDPVKMEMASKPILLDDKGYAAT